MAVIKVDAQVDLVDTDGSILSTQCIGDDITLDNFLQFFKQLFSQNASTQIPVQDINGENGNVRLNAMFDTTPTVQLHFGDGGGGAVTPTRAGNALVNEIANVTAVAPAALSTNVITVTGAILNQGAPVTAREIGLSMKWNPDAPDPDEQFLLFHDAITDTAVATNQALTVTYTFTFP